MLTCNLTASGANAAAGVGDAPAPLDQGQDPRHQWGYGKQPPA
jgi:hypothetical protein